MSDFREIEHKLIVSGSTLESVNNLMRHLLLRRTTRAVYGYSRDVYYHTHKPDMFARIRERDGILQVTVKVEDQGDAFNRLEVDLNCTSSMEAAEAHHNALFGPAAGVIEKKYFVYWTAPKTTVCCYQCTVDGVERPEIILEIEGPAEAGVEELTKEVTEFYAKGADIARAPGSLYSMYLKAGRPSHTD